MILLYGKLILRYNLLLILGIFCCQFCRITFSQNEKTNLDFVSIPDKNFFPVNRALIIGVSDYLNFTPKLNYADDDALAMFQFLNSKANETTNPQIIKILLNDSATADAIMNQMELLLFDCKAGENILFYFSGHGEGGYGIMNDYLVCYDTKPERPYASIQFQNISKMAREMCFKKNVNITLIIDACKSGGIAFQEYFSNSPEDREYENKHVLKIFSSQSNEKSYEDVIWKHPMVINSEGGGVFTYNLLLGLYGLADVKHDGFVKFTELRTYIQENVNNQTSENQNPSIYGNNNAILTRVDAEIFSQIQTLNNMKLKLKNSADKCGNPPYLNRNNFDSIPNSIYLDFRSKILNNNLLVPEGDNAYTKYLSLHNSHDSSKLINNMKYELISALRNKTFSLMDQYYDGMMYYDSVLVYDANKNLKAALSIIEENEIFYNELQAQQYFFEGILLYQNNHIDSAINLFNEGIRLTPYAGFIYNELGILYLKKGNYSLAKSNFVLANLYYNKWVIPVYNLGLLYFDTELDYKQAIYSFNKAIELKNTFIPAYVMRGNSYYRIKNYNKAIKDWETAIKLNPERTNELLPLIKDAKRRKVKGLK